MPSLQEPFSGRPDKLSSPERRLQQGEFVERSGRHVARDVEYEVHDCGLREHRATYLGVYSLARFIESDCRRDCGCRGEDAGHFRSRLAAPSDRRAEVVPCVCTGGPNLGRFSSMCLRRCRGRGPDELDESVGALLGGEGEPHRGADPGVGPKPGRRVQIKCAARMADHGRAGLRLSARCSLLAVRGTFASGGRGLECLGTLSQGNPSAPRRRLPGLAL